MCCSDYQYCELVLVNTASHSPRAKHNTISLSVNCFKMASVLLSSFLPLLIYSLLTAYHRAGGAITSQLECSRTPTTTNMHQLQLKCMCDQFHATSFKAPDTRVSKGIFCIYTDLQNGKLFQDSLGHEKKKNSLLSILYEYHGEFRIQMQKVFLSIYQGLLIDCLNNIILIFFQKSNPGSLNRSQKE